MAILRRKKHYYMERYEEIYDCRYEILSFSGSGTDLKLSKIYNFSIIDQNLTESLKHSIFNTVKVCGLPLNSLFEKDEVCNSHKNSKPLLNY